jgi:hypothetical protein
MTHQLPIYLLLTLGLGAGASACSRARSDTAYDTKTNVPSAATEAKTPSAPQSVALDGCLQQGSRGVYILTELNEPDHPDSSKQGVVARERTDAAQHAYRLLSDRDTDLSKLVGKEVQVQGVETRASDLNPPADATSVTQIKQQDLARVQIDSIRTVGNSCG